MAQKKERKHPYFSAGPGSGRDGLARLMEQSKGVELASKAVEKKDIKQGIEAAIAEARRAARA